jgi:hypothetical protein
MKSSGPLCNRGLGREEGEQARTLGRLTFFTCKQVRRNCLTDLERSLDLTVAWDLWRTVATTVNLKVSKQTRFFLIKLNGY